MAEKWSDVNSRSFKGAASCYVNFKQIMNSKKNLIAFLMEERGKSHF